MNARKLLVNERVEDNVLMRISLMMRHMLGLYRMLKSGNWPLDCGQWLVFAHLHELDLRFHLSRLALEVRSFTMEDVGSLDERLVREAFKLSIAIRSPRFRSCSCRHSFHVSQEPVNHEEVKPWEHDACVCYPDVQDEEEHEEDVKVQQGRVMIGAMDYHSMQMSVGVGALDDGMVQQRLHALARQRDALVRQRDALTRLGDEVQQMEIELKAQVIARSEIMELQNSFEIRMKVQVDLAVKLQMSGGVGALDDGMVQQRLHALARQRDALARQRDALARQRDALTRQGDEVQQMEIELKARVIAKSEIMELQISFEIRMKEQVDLVVKLQEELSDREQKMHDLERKIEDQERELHAMRLDNEKARAKEDILQEQNKEIANFR
ncbi:hypothetical protein Droror1_Dr00025250 [Drosera rotundifolia]